MNAKNSGPSKHPWSNSTRKKEGSNKEKSEFGHINPVVISLAVWSALLLFISFSYLPSAEGRWESDSFENEVTMSVEPETPFNEETVNVTVTAEDAAVINAAHLYLEWTSAEGDTGQGGFELKRMNDSAVSVTVPGYPGGTSVEFYVIAWDEVNNQIQSDPYRYTVVSNGSWKYDDFKDNIELDYSPKHPDRNDSVEVTIRSRESNVPVKRADLHFLVEFPGLPAQEGLVYFNKINATYYNATVNPYPSGTKVTLWADIYDQYSNELTSPKYVYSTPEPRPTSPDYNVSLFAVGKDVREGSYVEGAKVTFRNVSWSYTTETVNGIAWTPYGLPRGEYEIDMSYQGENVTKTALIPNKEKNYTYYFSMNEGELGIGGPFINFPELPPIAAMGALVLLIPFFLIFARKEKDLDKGGTSGFGGEKEKAGSLSGRFKGAVWGDETKRLKSAKVGAFLILGVFGAAWAPFYPWWMIGLIGVVTAALSYRFSYLSLIMLNLFVIPAAAYQNLEFGWLYLIFATLILFVALFNWKFGYLVFLGIWISKFGLAFIVPAFGVMFYSLFTGVAAGVFLYLYLMFFTGFANMNAISLFVASPHEYVLATLSKTPPAEITPFTIAHHIGRLSHADLHAIGEVFAANFSSMLPFLELVLWIGALVLFWAIYENIGRKRSSGSALACALPAVIPSLAFLALMFHYDNRIPWETYVQSALLPLSLFSIVVFGRGIKKRFPRFFSEDREKEGVGTYLTDMGDFQKTDTTQVGGLTNIKEEIKNSVIIPLRSPELSEIFKVEPPHGILLFGPPGCGKTLLMRSIATKLEINMIVVKCSDLMSKWYGESEGAVDKLFTEAKGHRPCILFLDEIDAIAKSRDFYSTDDVTPRILSIMLSEMDGMDAFGGVMIVGATNKPDLIDPALLRPGRFDKVVFVPPPGKRTRKEILKIHLRDKPVSKRVDLARIAERTEKFSGADLANLVKEAATLAMMRAVNTGEHSVITDGDLRDVAEDIKPSITDTMIEEYREMEELYQRKRYGRKISRRSSPRGSRRAKGRYSGGEDDRYDTPSYKEIRDEWQRVYVCSKCGAKIAREDVACPECGVWFRNISSDTAPGSGAEGSIEGGWLVEEDDWNPELG